MSKALDLVRLLINGANEYEKETGNKNPTVYLSRNNLLVIEKALLKAQEQEKKTYTDELKLVEKKLKALDLLMQELDCKDFAELRKYARCGYQTFRNAKGANYDNIIIDEAVIPSEALECLEKLKGMEISSMPFSDEYGTQEVDLNDIRKVGSQLNTDFREYITTIKQALLKAQKDRKALEIIKEKRVNVGTFIHLTKILKKDYEQCKALNNTFGANICETEKEFLTKEEFNLLKEVLE